MLQHRLDRVFRIHIGIFCLFAAGSNLEAIAQKTVISIRGETAVLYSNKDSLPFWLTAQRDGLYSRSNPIVQTRFAVDNSAVLFNDFSTRIMLDMFIRPVTNSPFFFHQLYGSLEFKSVNLSAGWKEISTGLVDSTLSSGSMVLSQNAATFPWIGIEIPRFSTVPGTFDLIAIKARWSHGWLGKHRAVPEPLLHEKSVHFRFFGREDFPVLGFAGMTHAVIWGGTHSDFGKIPTRFSDYFDVILGRAGQHDTLENESVGTLGNSVGSLEFALQVTFKNSRVFAYRQFYLEAQSDIRLRNASDGIWGLSIQSLSPNYPIQKLLYEFIYTKNQGDRVPGPPRTDYSAYYSHGIYSTGWTHNGRTLGNPLLFSDGSIAYPVKNSILVAHHFGVAGHFAKRIKYKILATYSRNYGARDDCTDNGCSGNPLYYTGRLDQYSYLLELAGPLPIHEGLNFTFAFGVDHGKVYDYSVGSMIGVVWRSVH